MTRERHGATPPSVACFTDMATLLATLHARFGDCEATYALLVPLVQPMRAGVRLRSGCSQSLDRDPDFQMLLHCISTHPDFESNIPVRCAAARSVNLSMDTEDSVDELLAVLATPPLVEAAVIEVADARNSRVHEGRAHEGRAGDSLGAKLVWGQTTGATEADDDAAEEEGVNLPQVSIGVPRPHCVEPEKDVNAPVDWHTLPVFPTHRDLSGEPLQLPRNVTKGSYGDGDQYLMTHFCLLREDMVAPLRQGVAAYREGTLDDRDMPVYHDVDLAAIQCTSEGLVYRVRFKSRTHVDWSRSKRLLYGSLLALSCDDFKTITWATVANRDQKLLVDGCLAVDIAFPEALHHDFLLAQAQGVRYLMAESPTYFEAYRHVLQALQRMDSEVLPFSETLLMCKPKVDPPSFLKGSTDSDHYEMESLFPELAVKGKSGFSLLSNWPTISEMSTLDESQAAALRQVLTKEVALVQGPPGTGKTHIGLLAIRALLENSTRRNKCGSVPILVVCSTTHALDQFLEGVMQVESKVVRVGPRSQSDTLKSTNLWQKVMEERSSDEPHNRAWRALSKEQRECRLKIETLIGQLQQKEPTADDLEEVCTTAQIMSMCAAPDGWMDIEDALHKWLQIVRDAALERAAEAASSGGDGGRRAKFAAAAKGDEPAPVGKSAPQRIIRSQGNRDADWAAVTRIEYADEKEAEDEQWEQELLIGHNGERFLRTEVERLIEDGSRIDEDGRLISLMREGDGGWPGTETQEFLLEHDELWQLNWTQREQLAALWLHRKFESVYSDLSQLCERYERLCRDKAQLDQHMQLTILKHAAVIGMTTTAIAKLSAVVHALAVEVIVVEDAAEVLESHILVTLSPSTKQVVLIGDHRQVRPSATVHKLAKQFRLDVSMFERLINGSVEHVILECQRRMRPEMSNIIGSIYPQLSEHAPSCKPSAVRGIEKPIYLVRHTKPECVSGEARSRANPHEAKFLAALAAFLVRQGYAPSQITILSPYCGQLLLLKHELHELHCIDVTVASIDQYQGEENDLVLISLVPYPPLGQLPTTLQQMCIHACPTLPCVRCDRMRARRSAALEWTAASPSLCPAPAWACT